MQISELRLLGAQGASRWEELPVPDRHRTAPGTVPAEAVNVAELYAAIAHELRSGRRTAADFDAAVRLHRLLDTVRLSAATGTRRSPVR